jgi:hypothetical protein
MMNLIAPKQINLSLLSGWVTGVNNSLYLPFTSGDYLWNLITGSDSGTAVNVTGGAPMLFANLSGIGGFQIFQSGDSTILFSGAPNTSGDLTGAFYPLYANPANYATSGDITNLSGVLSGQIHNTGESLLALINAVSGQSPLNVVYTTGNQLISGEKTFNNLTTFLKSGIIFTTGPDIFSVNLGGVKSSPDLTVYQFGLVTSNQIHIGSGQLTYGPTGAQLISLDWVNKQLTGNWQTNTLPSLSGHLVNKGYLESGIRPYNQFSANFFLQYASITGSGLNEFWISNPVILTGIRAASTTIGSGALYFSSGTSGTPINVPFSGEIFQISTSNNRTTSFGFSYETGLTYKEIAVPNVILSGFSRIGITARSGISGAANFDVGLFGYSQY